MNYDELTQEIRSRIDIGELITEYVDLKRSGQNLKGLCPFHSERTPSFMVSPSKQIFHCFGCNKGGDIFTFIMNYENMTFSDAVSFLADRAGIEVKTTQKISEFKKSQKEKLYSINTEAMNFYGNCLQKSGQARSYLKERGIKEEFIEKFSLGFIENERDALFTHLKKQGFDEQDIKASGLAVLYDGKYHDFFRFRIIFPIFDIRGKCIAFGGRTLSSSKEIPKYINSADSVVFRKGENCYGMNFAKNSINQKGYSIIVEGYFDTIICHQFGFDNAVAPLGTALTNDQLMRIKRFSDKILLLFDGDSAGVAAAKRSLELIFSEALIAKILLLPKGEDPDTFLRKYGGDELKRYMVNAKKPVEFILSLYEKNKLDGARYILSMLSFCPDSLLRDEIICELSGISKLNELTLRQELKSIMKKASKQKFNVNKEGTLQKVTPSQMCAANKDEKTLLKIALSSPDNCSKIMSNIDHEKIESLLVREIFEKIISIMNNNQEFSLENLLSVCTHDEQHLITELSVDSEIELEFIDEIIESCMKAIEIRELEKQILQAAEKKDVSLLHVLLTEKNRLLSQKSL